MYDGVCYLLCARNACTAKGFFMCTLAERDIILLGRPSVSFTFGVVYLECFEVIS